MQEKIQKQRKVINRLEERIRQLKALPYAESPKEET